MNLVKKNWSFAFSLITVLFLTIGVEKKVYGQEQEGIVSAKQIKQIRIGPHPKYTRLLLDISGPVEYQVNANFVEKKIDLIFDDTSVTPKVKSKKYRDKNLASVDVQANEDQIILTLHLKNSNTRFFHHKEKATSQIVLDLKGTTEPFLKTRIGKKKPKKTEPPVDLLKAKGSKMKGLSPEQVKEITLKDEEERKKSGWEEYQKALKLYQEKKLEDYTIKVESEPDPETGETEEIEKIEPGAIKLFRKYAKDYPSSPLLPNILYLLAEAEFRIAWRQKYPNYEKALAAYQHATRKFPKSRFSDHALYKIGNIFEEIGYSLEARVLYNEGINQNKRSLYNTARKNSLANMLLKEKRYEEAYEAFQKILKKSPKSNEAQLAIIKIANQYFDQKDFIRALDIYNEAVRRWPSVVNKTPIIFNNMGEIYFKKRDYPKARKFYFNMINMDPTNKETHRALNRIGDLYLIQGKEMEALSVYDQSAKLDPENRESQYGKIRMADIGVRYPRLPVNDAIFDVSTYFEPLKTYDKILESAKDVDILSEVTLSKGIALLKEQNYLEAIQEFKKLLPLGEESKFHRDAAKYIRQSLVFLVDGYAKQGGVLPILYSYTDYASLSIGKIKSLKTLLQVGEAYQSLGMFPEAVRLYEKVKQMDARKTHNDRIFLNLGEIHYERGNYSEAEFVARSFLKNFPRSKKVRDAMKLLAKSLNERKQHDDALKIYQNILEKFPKFPSEIHYLVATLEVGRNKSIEAIAAYEKTIDSFDRTQKIVPDYLREAHYKLANSLYQEGQYPESIESFNTAIKLFPDHPHRSWSEFISADALKKIKNNQKATAQLNQLIKSQPKNDLIKKAAQSQLKIMEWEKENANTL